VSPFDKSGTIVLEDAFGDGLVHCQTGAGGTGASVEIDNTEAAVGGHSCKIIGGSDGTRRSAIAYYTHATALNKLGLEWSVRFGDDVELFEVRLWPRDEAYWYDARIQYTPDTDKWELYDWNEEAWVAFLENVPYQVQPNDFSRFKLVVDVPNLGFHRFVHTNGSVDLTGYGLLKTSEAIVPRILATFQVKSTEGKNGFVLLDDIIITQDES